ncbi:formyltransferase/hydrolase complex Fhc subunit C [archaeon BMS3Abin16]|nr:formyltransferase/hydrolase complex Fhc subunit C [archaeon BMS3Abin16]HDY74066.1 formylmethanofuran dehydrogenase subunit C [Euryarchaeota archaeon]
MKEIILKVISQPTVGLEAENIAPKVFACKSSMEIAGLPIYEGNRERRLGDFFDVSGEAGEAEAETRIVIEGDVRLTKRIGQGMRAGEIHIKGSAGMHLGSKMRGGKVTVEGDCEAFCFQEMRGGVVHIKGNAGNYLGSATRGNWRGMRGGTITVDGNAGSEIATFMKGGKIHVKGDCASFAGVHMNKGFIVIDGRAERRIGAEMIGGTIVANEVEAMLAGFKPVETVKAPEIESEKFTGNYKKYSGDHADSRAKGTVWVKIQ